MADDANNTKPGWGATIGVYFLSLLCIGFAAGLTSMMGLNMRGFSGYTVGGILSWLAALASAGYYRSTGKMGGAIGVALGIGVAIGLFAAFAGPSIVGARYGV